MDLFIPGIKIGMTQIIDGEDSAVIPVTVVRLLPVTVSQQSPDNQSVVAYGATRSEKKVSKPRIGQFVKYALPVSKFFRSFVGQSAEVFDFSRLKVGDFVNVRGVSIGKGFAGTIKRWNFNRGPMSHGSKSHRIPGSIGGGTTPGRVVKGKKMSGHMGARRVCVRNLEIVRIDLGDNLVYVRGAIPGKRDNHVELYR
jgi:large subunit ribosomal protein L3